MVHTVGRRQEILSRKDNAVKLPTHTPHTRYTACAGAPVAVARMTNGATLCPSRSGVTLLGGGKGGGGGGGGGDNPANCASSCQYCQGYRRCGWSTSCVNRYGNQYGWGCYY